MGSKPRENYGIKAMSPKQDSFSWKKIEKIPCPNHGTKTMGSKPRENYGIKTMSPKQDSFSWKKIEKITYPNHGTKTVGSKPSAQNHRCRLLEPPY